MENNINFIFKKFPYWKDKHSPILNFLQTFIITIFIIFKLKDLNIDIVHLNDGKMKNTWALASRILNKRIIFHQRTIFDNSRLSFLLLFIPDKIIAISDFAKNSLPTRFKKKTLVIYNPFRSINISPKKDSKINLCKKLSLNNQKYVLSCIGSVTNQKRPIIAIKTLYKLKEKGIPAILLFIGKISSEKKNSLSAEIKRCNLDKNIKILGYKKNIEPYLKGSDFIIAPATNEGFGRVLIESMLAKTPVIASDHGGHKEIIKNKINGILIKPNSPSEMAKAIENLIVNKKEYARIVNNALVYASENYNIKNHLNSIIQIYLNKK